MDIIILAGLYTKKLWFWKKTLHTITFNFTKKVNQSYWLALNVGHVVIKVGEHPIYTIPVDNCVMLTVSIRITHYCYAESNSIYSTPLTIGMFTTTRRLCLRWHASFFRVRWPSLHFKWKGKCKCRFKCFSKLPEDRKELFSTYWNLSDCDKQRQLSASTHFIETQNVEKRRWNRMPFISRSEK